ncbi:MAG: hypothetical protein GY725_15260 [bacterium]|nr:hypothetical protein [bacterium]
MEQWLIGILTSVIGGVIVLHIEPFKESIATVLAAIGVAGAVLLLFVFVPSGSTPTLYSAGSISRNVDEGWLSSWIDGIRGPRVLYQASPRMASETHDTMTVAGAPGWVSLGVHIPTGDIIETIQRSHALCSPGPGFDQRTAVNGLQQGVERRMADAACRLHDGRVFLGEAQCGEFGGVLIRCERSPEADRWITMPNKLFVRDSGSAETNLSQFNQRCNPRSQFYGETETRKFFERGGGMHNAADSACRDTMGTRYAGQFRCGAERPQVLCTANDPFADDSKWATVPNGVMLNGKLEDIGMFVHHCRDERQAEHLNEEDARLTAIGSQYMLDRIEAVCAAHGTGSYDGELRCQGDVMQVHCDGTKRLSVREPSAQQKALDENMRRFIEEQKRKNQQKPAVQRQPVRNPIFPPAVLKFCRENPDDGTCQEAEAKGLL